MDDRKHQKYCVVVQENNEAFKDVLSIVKECNPKFYAFIKHEADEEHNNNHYHLVIDFGKNNGKTFEEMHRIFVDCHEEPCNSIEGSCAYLTHETQQAIEDNKKRYERCEVITNDFALYNAYANKGALFVFDDTQIEYYINVKGYVTYWDFMKHFGAKQVQPFKISIDYAIQHFYIQEAKQNVDLDYMECRKRLEQIELYCYDLHSSKEDILKRIRNILNIVDND